MFSVASIMRGKPEDFTVPELSDRIVDSPLNCSYIYPTFDSKTMSRRWNTYNPCSFIERVQCPIFNKGRCPLPDKDD